MKKWIIVLLVFLVPMGLFFVLSKTMNCDVSSLDIQAAQAASKPYVIKFSSTMCADCQELEKIMKDVEPEYKDKINFYSYKVDGNDKKIKGYIAKYKITLVPTMILVDKDGNDKLKIEGLVSRDVLEQNLKALINE